MRSDIFLILATVFSVSCLAIELFGLLRLQSNPVCLHAYEINLFLSLACMKIVVDEWWRKYL